MKPGSYILINMYIYVKIGLYMTDVLYRCIYDKIPLMFLDTPPHLYHSSKRKHDDAALRILQSIVVSPLMD